MQAGTDTFENNMEVPQDVKRRAILRPTNCTTGYLPIDTELGLGLGAPVSQCS